MPTRMGEEDWTAALRLPRACRGRPGDKGGNDRKCLEAMHRFTLHYITGRALPSGFGNWSSVRERFWRTAFAQSPSAILGQPSPASDASPSSSAARRRLTGARCHY